MQKYDTIIVGGGAAGLMAAGQSAELAYIAEERSWIVMS